jgi:hypothetical protein
MMWRDKGAGMDHWVASPPAALSASRHRADRRSADEGMRE